jgi:8-oxo-dGTP pyrophosphatase MutT (NUDIX family)
VAIDRLEGVLIDALERRLPGPQAQALMAPRPRVGWQPGRLPDDARPGAGLLLIYPHDGCDHIVLTLRESNLPQHPGQVSLPGGAVDPGETAAAAALREAHEEIAVDPSGVRVLGELSPLHIPVSGYVLRPFVGSIDRRPALRPEAGEVARILEVPIDHLLDPARLEVQERRFERGTYEVPVFHVSGEQVWGATAMILAEFLSLIGHPPAAWGVDDEGR